MNMEDRLTKGQRAALEAMGNGDRTYWTRATPFESNEMRVNFRAADSLCALGLAMHRTSQGRNEYKLTRSGEEQKDLLGAMLGPNS